MLDLILRWETLPGLIVILIGLLMHSFGYVVTGGICVILGMWRE